MPHLQQGPLRAFYCSSQLRAISKTDDAKAMMRHAVEAPRERSQIASVANWVMSIAN